MIPKIIHYCWFGRNPLPPLAQDCIASWKKYLPDYEIKEWNEDNFDVNVIPYTAEAYRAHKYAFVSDYARFWILYNYGGLYFDTDVEIIRPLDDVIAAGAFMGFERNPDGKRRGLVAPGLGLGGEKENLFWGLMLNHYETLHFVDNNGCLLIDKTVVHHTTDILEKLGLNSDKKQIVSGITIYPAEYFAPIHFVTRRLHITNNTRTIHRYMGSWADKKPTMLEKFKRFCPEWLLIISNKIKRKD